MWVVAVLYAWFLFASLTNLLLMRRPKGTAQVCFEIMIPARNEAENLPLLLTPLQGQNVRVTIFDDESSDGTAAIAAELGASVVPSPGDLPPGWTGKNRACHELALRATAEWVVFLDADTRPSPDFASRLSAMLNALDPEVKVLSGCLRMEVGRGLEPAYLGWVPWIILATNPLGLVSRTGKGHNRFTNGQFSCWRKETLDELRPYETLKGEILEDVKIGRLLAKRGIRAEVADVSEILSVRMYRDLREAFNGMSKNSADIAGGFVSSLLFALFLVFAGWAWVLTGPYWWAFLSILLATKLFGDRIIRYPLWTVPLLPITCLAAAATVIRSLILKRRGRLEWKGRTYGGRVG